MQAEAEAESVRVSWGMAPVWHSEGLGQGFLILFACFGFLRLSHCVKQLTGTHCIKPQTGFKLTQIRKFWD